jgi:methyl-accepting chemotaxis protein
MTNLFGLDRRVRFALAGFLLGAFAPVGWSFLRLLFFGEKGIGIWPQISGYITSSPESLALFAYMGVGTSLMLGCFGFLIGKGTQEIHDRALRLDALYQTIGNQKEEFERRFREMHNGIKNFHAINTHIQKSVSLDEVLRLSADGLHKILGYDRVNILMVGKTHDTLTLMASRGCGDDSASGISIPLDERAGALYLVVKDKRVILVEDIGKMPQNYRMRPPCDTIEQLRSRSFILCPILVRGEVVGLFGVDNKIKHKALDETDVDTVKLFADQVSGTWTKINLLDAVETLTDQLERTFQELLKYRDEHARHDTLLKRSAISTGEAITHIAGASNVIRERVETTRSTAGEISVSIEQVSQNLHQLTDFMENSISAMTEISRTIVNVQESAARSHGMSEQVREQAEHGVGSVSNAMRGLKGISAAVEMTVAGIGRLSEKGEEINSITTVIHEITQKTNLLALNAAIIAAQAGEHGRSFAVVADEVRSLSQEAAFSTGAITRIIDEIQTYTSESVDQITATRDLVGEGIALGEGVERSLKQILDSASLAMAMTHNIRKATQEVASSVQSVSVSIEELGEISSQVTLASRGQAHGTRSIVHSIEEVKNMADTMSAETEKQQKNMRDIEHAIAAVSEMVRQIFLEMEERRQESRGVIDQLECFKEEGLTK